MLVSLQFDVPSTLLFGCQRKCHHTPQDKVFALSHNSIVVYSCIEGTTLRFRRDADNEINEYLIDAGALDQLVYELKLRQGVLNHFQSGS